MAVCGTSQQRRSRLPAPRQGGGVRCAALFGCRVRPDTRCAASLRMTQRVAGEWEEKQNAVFVRTVKRRIIPVACTIYHTKHIWYHAPVTHVSS